MNVKQISSLAILISSFLILSSAHLKAQDYGLKTGLVISTVNGQGNTNLKPGAQLGVYKNFGATEKLFVQMEALVTQKGSWNWDSENVNNINLYYFDFAIMFGILLDEKFTINLGIQPSIFLGGSYHYSVDDQKIKENLGGTVSAMDYATLFGLEYDLSDDFTIGGRFNYSFVPLQSYDNIFADNGELPYSMVVQLYGKVKMDKLLNIIKK
ncbi:Outer membrane protein beta-barrel domain-containing protein [Marivirga sericea]|uniref:Outer membrane protein beta-barrel domain-containing protein n=1 Tax=Marivirga sericea TaxID=1028 RepID=A0A1X7KG35_9BACT|nr:outer membrane beta-barrel protein [Marivirga sericea]SMG40100.1 Outer membrane protein beta-barrel domain-containing protein [Marivirga sericea]